MKNNQYTAAYLLAGTVLIGVLGVGPSVALAGPAPLVAARSGSLTLPQARELLERSTGRAADLEARPALWDWTNPMTIHRVGQANPAPVAQAQPTAQAAPAPEDDTDILDEVSVTATRRPTRERDTTATTYSVKREDFRAQGAQTATDALALVPGFIGQPSLGGVRNAGANFLRGFNDQRFQVLRDGLSQTFPQNGRSAVAQFLLDDLERIEVVTGGATLRYGAGAVGGVINLITETPKGPPKLTLDYQVGSYGYSRYSAKYGGGDDTFSYNLIYSSLVAFNDFPFGFTVPNTARFYGPTTNPGAAPPEVAIGNTIFPEVYPNGTNSFGIGGPGAADPDNSGPIDLYGYLKPDVGPAVRVNGRADASYNAQDSYTAKLTFKPDPANKLTLRVNQTNRNFDDQGPGANSFNICLAGATSAADGNGTFAGERFFPLDRNGNEVNCNPGRYVIGTASTQFAFGFPFNFNTSYDGRTVFPTGQPYGFAEGALANILFFQRRNTANTDISLNWDYELSPTASINTYAYYYRQVFTTFRPSPYFVNTGVFSGPNGQPGEFDAIPFGLGTQPYSDGNKFEAQTALNWQLSPGQNLQFGINFVEDRVFQQQGRGRTFFERAIARTSIFLIDDISFGPELKANLGLRYTSSSQFGEVLTPGIGLRYSPLSWLSLRGNWSQVFNAPNIADLYVISGIFIDNPNLQPETGATYDVGVDITPARNLGLRLTYFNTSLNNFFTAIQFVAPGVGLQQQIRNIAGQRASGIEAEVNWQITDQLRLRLAWTNTDSRPFGLTDSIENGNFLYGFQSANIPFNNLIGVLSYTNRGNLVALTGRYDSGKRRSGSNLFVPAWATLDLAVEVPVTPFFTLTGNVFNLTDTQYEFVDGSPAPGTTFRVGGRFEIGG